MRFEHGDAVAPLKVLKGPAPADDGKGGVKKGTRVTRSRPATHTFKNVAGVRFRQAGAPLPRAGVSSIRAWRIVLRDKRQTRRRPSTTSITSAASAAFGAVSSIATSVPLMP